MSFRELNGLVLVDKISGPSSFDVVRLVRRGVRMRRVGHAGTLDPLAEGLLAVCLGEACKLVPFLQEQTKRYLVRIALGRETETLDAEGEVTRRAPVPPLDKGTVETVLSTFVGRIQQVPPIFSAVKKDGVKLYKKARRGEAASLEPREVQIDAISLTCMTETTITLSVDCSKGTYIRSLARDIAHALGTVGMVDFLRRTSCSGFQVEKSVPFDDLNRGADIEPHLIAMPDALPLMPKVVLSAEEETVVRNGGVVPDSLRGDDDMPFHVALLSEDRRLIAVAHPTENGFFQPVRVMLDGKKDKR